LEVARGTAQWAGKAGEAVAKGAVSGVKMAWKSATAKDDDNGGKEKHPISNVGAAAAKPPPKTIAEMDPSLDLEVTEALQRANEALSVRKMPESAAASKSKDLTRPAEGLTTNINESE